jgi:ferric-dicitrate binding protein FerR (iron transport regulator)
MPEIFYAPGKGGRKILRNIECNVSVMHKKFKKYINGSCTVEEYNETREFINNPENDIFLNSLLKETWKENLTKQNDIEPNSQLLNQVHHKIALTETTTQRTLRLYQTISGVAAVLIIGLILGILFYFPPGNNNNNITQNITTPYGGKTHFTLSDGTEVWLNSGSTITYPGQFTETREVTLTGEAYFNVTHNSHPFIVSGNFGQIEVLGTEFNVKAYEGEACATTLVRGSVLFRSNNKKQVILKPGNQVVYGSGKMLTKKVEPEFFTSWKDGKLIFREEPLQNIATRLERWYNVDIELKGEDIKNLKYNGTIELESFSEVLELIKVTTPIEYYFDRDTRVLTITSVKP